MLYFRTPGQLPIEALTIMGLSAKPQTDDPFGRFGTGLKYAIAVTMRIGGSVRIETPAWSADVVREPMEFRGVVVDDVLSLKMDGIDEPLRLPFTIGIGKDWEPWQAYRELRCNTEDEYGTIATTDNPDIDSNTTTLIKVEGLDGEHTTSYMNFLFDNEITFEFMLPMDDGRRVFVYSPSDSCIKIAPPGIFHRGVRVYSTGDYDGGYYNIIGEVPLDESRNFGGGYRFLREMFSEHLYQNKRLIDYVFPWWGRYDAIADVVPLRSIAPSILEYIRERVKGGQHAGKHFHNILREDYIRRIRSDENDLFEMGKLDLSAIEDPSNREIIRRDIAKLRKKGMLLDGYRVALGDSTDGFTSTFEMGGSDTIILNQSLLQDPDPDELFKTLLVIGICESHNVSYYPTGFVNAAVEELTKLINTKRGKKG